MKVLAIMLLTLSLAQEKATPTDVSGAWNLTMETPQGAMAIGLTIKLEGEKITGEISSDRGSLAIQGTVDKETIKFSGETNGFTLTFTGKPGPTEMTGTVDFGGNGSAPWSAKRP
jgi:quinohemoprotein ethanol dehydrogenase